MKFIALLRNILFLLLLSQSVCRLHAQSYEFKQYGNARFGYCALYPAGFLYPQKEADNGDGLQMLSTDRSIEMTVYGSHNVPDSGKRDTLSLLELYEKEAFDISHGKAGKMLTLHRIKKDHFVISGYKKERIYYEKVVMRARKIYTLYFEYPAGKKEEMDTIVRKASHAFPDCNLKQ